LRSNTKGYGGKTHCTDLQNSDIIAASGTELTICNSRSRRPVRKLLVTPSYYFDMSKTNSIEQGSSRELTSRLAGKLITHLLRDQNSHYRW